MKLGKTKQLLGKLARWLLVAIIFSGFLIEAETIFTKSKFIINIGYGLSSIFFLTLTIYGSLHFWEKYKKDK